MTLEWSDLGSEKRIDRILAMTPDCVVLFTISDPNALPISHPKSEILDALERKDCTLLPPVSSPQLHRQEKSIPEYHRKRRDCAWAVIKSIIEVPDHGAFDSKIRGKLILETMVRTGKKKKYIYNYLRKYWRYGCAKTLCFHVSTNVEAKGNYGLPVQKNGGGRTKREGSWEFRMGLILAQKKRTKFVKASNGSMTIPD